MYQDEIIAEIWRIREEYAAQKHHDLKEMVADLEERQRRPHSVVVDRRPRYRQGPGADASFRVAEGE